MTPLVGMTWGCTGKPGSGRYAHSDGWVVGGSALYSTAGAGAKAATVFGVLSLLHLTKMKASTMTAASDHRTIPTMAPAERPPLSSSSSGLVGLVGILPLPGALVPAE